MQRQSLATTNGTCGNPTANKQTIDQAQGTLQNETAK
jgi:hypothetical protein